MKHRDPQGTTRHSEAGSSFTEFTIVMGLLLSVVLTALLFLSVFSQYGTKVLSLIGVETP